MFLNSLAVLVLPSPVSASVAAGTVVAPGAPIQLVEEYLSPAVKPLQPVSVSVAPTVSPVHVTGTMVPAVESPICTVTGLEPEMTAGRSWDV